MAHLTTVVVSLLVTFSFAAQPDNPDPLRGPDVPDHATHSLVSKTMTGRFEPLRVRPEAAALQELDLDEASRAKAREIVDQRGADIAMALVDHIDDVKEMTDMITAGQQDRARERLGEMWGEIDEGTPRDPLAKPLEGVLDAEQRGQLKRLVDEYWEAWIDWELRKNDKARGDPAARERVEHRLAFGLFEREVREAYNYSLKRYKDALDGVYDAVQPTDEQRAEIREIVLEHIRATRLSATPEQRRETNMKIYRLLDDERKEKLFAYMTRIVIPDG
ncbi:MAG: hypothetical protein H6810_01880 [Phycisphaeraceae bacterium]|nr:MAG: hypothetical protein H6810_01880 [Phycisphaeraceae bacterium]